MIQPLVEAGLAMDEIQTVLCRLAFDAMVGEDCAAVADIVVNQSPRVRAAWVETVGRLLALPSQDA